MSKLILDVTSTNPLDLTNYTYSSIDIKEAPTYVNGKNVGTSKNGFSIFDRIHTRYSFSIPLRPMPSSTFSEIIKLCEKSEMYVNYDSARGDVTERAQVSLSGWEYAMTKDGERIYHNAVITVQGA